MKNYIKLSSLVFLFFLNPLVQAEGAWCLDTYNRHHQAARKAVIASGGVTAAGIISAMVIGPFAIIPIAIAGGGIITASYYEKQYEKAHALIQESDPNYRENYNYVLRIAKSAKLAPGMVSQIIWKNESKFCKGKVPWTYRTIRKAIKKRKLTL